MIGASVTTGRPIARERSGMKVRSSIAAALVILTISAALAADYTMVIDNRTDWAIRSVTVRDAEVSGFQGPCKNTTCSVIVSMPEGECISRIRVNFANLQHISDDMANLCDTAPLVIQF